MKTRPAPSETGFDPSALHAVLYAHYGPSRWWPGESPLEVMAGAVLTQNTAWRNVEKAIANIKDASLMDLEKLARADEAFIARLIRPSGYYNLKARRLKNLVTMVHERSGGSLERFLNLDARDLRSALLSVTGIGRETADSICCYAANKLVFVVDAYTRRILARHGVIDHDADYDDVRVAFERSLPESLDVYKDLHAHIVFVGKDYCLRTRPRCGQCPLRDEKAWAASGPSRSPVPTGRVP